MLREYLEGKARPHTTQPDFEDNSEGEEGSQRDFLGEGSASYVVAQQTVSRDASERLKKAVVLVKYNNRTARLLVNLRPPKAGWAWFQYEDKDDVFKADLAKVQLVALVEG